MSLADPYIPEPGTCPAPINGKTTAPACIAAGYCGCDENHLTVTCHGDKVASPSKEIAMHQFRVVKGTRHMGYIEAENYTLALKGSRETFGEFDLKVLYIVPSK